jgi:hypothetical protein
MGRLIALAILCIAFYSLSQRMGAALGGVQHALDGMLR